MHYLPIPAWAWAATIAALAAFIVADLTGLGRRGKPVRLAGAAVWAAGAVALALGFGALLAVTTSGAAARQFYAGWLTEYSLSLDNLFVFVLLIGRSTVSQRLHGRVLMLGILLALVLRGILIGASAAALHRFEWVQYLFGVVLLAAAVRTALNRDGPPLPGGGASLGRPRTGRLAHFSPLIALIIMIGATDVLFAIDSIPAVFGLTRDPFLVFSANMFALLGLRHLYVLIGGLLGKLAHLSAGLSVVLGFIGLKIIGEALRDSGIRQLGPVPVPGISAEVSLAVIGAVIGTTILTSLIASRRAQPAPPGSLPLAVPAAPRPGESAPGEPAAPTEPAAPSQPAPDR
ncbi:MAG: TerC family protein [Nocardiopsaceae bacterium]|nr:TerC family protein [Nocardiopsaceae bacterium]